jgi:hypothetical protein
MMVADCGLFESTEAKNTLDSRRHSNSALRILLLMCIRYVFAHVYGKERGRGFEFSETPPIREPPDILTPPLLVCDTRVLVQPPREGKVCPGGGGALRSEILR